MWTLSYLWQWFVDWIEFHLCRENEDYEYYRSFEPEFEKYRRR